MSGKQGTCYRCLNSDSGMYTLAIARLDGTKDNHDYQVELCESCAEIFVEKWTTRNKLFNDKHTAMYILSIERGWCDDKINYVDIYSFQSIVEINKRFIIHSPYKAFIDEGLRFCDPDIIYLQNRYHAQLSI